MTPLRRGIGKPQPIAVASLLWMSLLFAGSALRPALLPALLSATLPPPAGLALPLGLFAFVSASFSVFQGQKWPRGGHIPSSIAIGLGLFAIPALLAQFALPIIDGAAKTALTTITLVLTLTFQPYLDSGGYGRPPAALPAALVAVCGAACVFPVSLPMSMPAASAVAAILLGCASAAAANCRAAALARQLPPNSLAAFSAIAAGSAALILAIASLLRETSHWTGSGIAEFFWAAVVELPGLSLLFWLLPRLSATRLATRFLLAPLLAVSLGTLLLQAPLQPRTWLGLLAMAGGAAYLLAAGDSHDEPNRLFPFRQLP